MTSEHDASIYLFTRAQVNEIAERAAEIALERQADAMLERLYLKVGKSIVSKFLWAVGTGLLALAAWMSGAGHLPK